MIQKMKLGPRTWTFGFNGYGQIWIKRKLNPGPETGLKAGQNTVSTKDNTCLSGTVFERVS